jgi:hypothetical protein
MKRSYPWLALGLGLILGLVLMRYGAPGGAGGHKLPLLTGLLMAEFGFLVTTIAAGVCVRDLVKQGIDKLAVVLLIGNLLLAVNFIRLGLQLWPGSAGG